MTGGDESSRHAFELLANATRLSIITALGNASGDDGYATLAFTDLQSAAGVEDNGKFAYHLNKLTETFVEQKESGYGLTMAGIRAYQAVVGQRSNADVEVPEFTLPEAEQCDDCGTDLVGWYTNSRFHCGCPDCGTLEMRYPVSTTNFDPDDSDSLVEAFTRRLRRDDFSMMHGICPYCTGHVQQSFAHADGYWEDNDLREVDALLHLACDSCAWFIYGIPTGKVYHLMPIAAFLVERGFDTLATVPWAEPFGWDMQVLEDDPWLVEVTYELDGDRLTAVIDDEVNVVEYEIEPLAE